MKKRLPYAGTIVDAAVGIARKTFEGRGVMLAHRRGRYYIARTVAGEGLPLQRGSRSWQP